MPPASRVALDVSPLPTCAFGHRSVMWWATMCMIAIEGTAFALAITSYLYLKGRVPHWPPGTPTPAMFWGSVNVVILLASAWPNALAKKAAERFDLGGVRLWMSVALVFALAFNAVRFLEFGQLNVRWDTNAYGSVTWFLLGVHTTHVLTDFLDSAVLAGVMFCRARGRAAVRRRVGERAVLELRRRVLAPDLCRHLPCATDRLAAAHAWPRCGRDCSPDR